MSVRETPAGAPSASEPSAREPSAREPSAREPSAREPSAREPSVRETSAAGTAPPRRIGLLGGTLDPIHAGHLDIARRCATELALDEVRFLCAAVPPHKAQPEAAGHHRHAMAALATACHPDFVADPRELLRGGTTYTIDTLEEIAAEEPGAELVFLAGADSLRDLRAWRRPDDILSLAVLVAVGREGVDMEHAADGFRDEIRSGRIRVLSHRPPPWSSTSLRHGLARGDSPPGALDTLVLRYIRMNGLYGTRPAAAPAGRNP